MKYTCRVGWHRITSRIGQKGCELRITSRIGQKGCELIINQTVACRSFPSMADYDTLFFKIINNVSVVLSL